MYSLRCLGASRTQLTDIYTKQIRSILEFSTPVWTSTITKKEIGDIERVQKAAAHIVLGPQYKSYSNALKTLGIQSLEDRRHKLSLSFALKCERNAKHSKWFKLNPKFSEKNKN